MKFHSQSPEEALKNLQSSVNGLDSETVKKNRVKYGWNEIPEKGKTHWIWILSQLANISAKNNYFDEF